MAGIAAIEKGHSATSTGSIEMTPETIVQVVAGILGVILIAIVIMRRKSKKRQQQQDEF